MKKSEFINLFSERVLSQQAFVFIIDFECEKFFLYSPDEASKKGILFDIKGKTNCNKIEISKKIELEIQPIEKAMFSDRYNTALEYLENGYSYLLNLTFPSRINTAIDLSEIFHLSKAPYKLLFQDKFVVFSPECFVRINGNEIYTYPMKGTIDANIPNAKEILLNNKKEEWEHNTIVDLLRNDMAMIAKDITVTRYRYPEKIKTHKNEIYQTSSEIKGILDEHWRNTIGEDFLKLLPAGSISGAPKEKTLEIIKECEIDSRGFYTGVFGFFDGSSIDSAVSIRFIEKNNHQLYFRSGGGITANSKMEDEYLELVQKIYIPVS
ncbi:MAG: aminodeoxychorismate synthase component I [Bacteroidetes bacterium]|nr:aminodeoxychorismate synthase component I [Bacteroidota bacterium]